MGVKHYFTEVEIKLMWSKLPHSVQRTVLKRLLRKTGGYLTANLVDDRTKIHYIQFLPSVIKISFGKRFTQSFWRSVFTKIMQEVWNEEWV